MPIANIQINGFKGSNGDLPINTIVQLSNADIGGELTYQWEIVDQPPGAADALNNSLIENPTFTPRKEGTYRLRLTVNIGTGTESIATAIAAVRHLKSFIREPSAGETNEEDATDGWKKDLNVALDKLDDVIGDANLLVCKLPGASVPAVGDIVKFSGTGLIKTGLPGEERVSLVETAPATSSMNMALELGIVVGTPSGAAPAANQLGIVRRFGLVEVTESGAPAVNDIVYVSDTFQPSLTAGTNVRALGRVVESSAGTWRWLIDGAASTIAAAALPIVVDLRAAPYLVVADDTSPAVLVRNRVGIQLALDTLTNALLWAPKGRINADKGAGFGTYNTPSGSRKLKIVGHGRDATTFVQYGTGNGGDWHLWNLDGCSDIELAECGFEQGLIAWPDGGQQNHMVVVSNNVGGGINKNVRLRGVRFGKCVGDALRVLSNASPEVVDQFSIDDFDMVLNGVVFPNWAGSTAYQVGMRVVNDGDKQYICVKAGTSAPAGGPTGKGQITFSDLVVSAVDTALDTVTGASHSRHTGDGPAQVTTTGTLLGGLAVSMNYWLIVVDANTLKFATSAVNAHAGTAIDLTSTGSGTNTIVDIPGTTQRAITDNTAVWDFAAARAGARSGIALQRGFRNVSFTNGRIIGAQNSLIDFEPTVNAEMNGAVFENIRGDNSLGNTASAMSFSGVSGGDNIKNLRVTDVTCLAGRINISGCDNALFERLTSIIDTTLAAEPTAVNVQVRQDCNDITFKDCRIERNGGTAATLFSLENVGNRTTIEGGLFVQGTVTWPIMIDGAPGGLYINGPTVRYTAGSGASSLDAIVVQAVAANIDICHIDDVKVQCVTGTLRAVINLQVRAPRTLDSIRITNISAMGEATYGVYFGIGTTGIPVWDRSPVFEKILASIPWYTVNQGDNPLPGVIHPRAKMWVADFGAKGDWDPATSTGTDDRNAFINAFAWLAGTGRGAELVIPPGNWRLSKYVVLDGARGAKITASAFASIYFASDNPSTVYDATALSYAQARSAFLLKNCQDTTIDGVEFVGGSTQEISNINLGCGIYATRSVGTRVINCRQRQGYSIFVQDSQADTMAASGSTLVVSSGIVTLTNDGDSNYAFHPNMVGRLVTIANATNKVNNGVFVVLSVSSVTQLTYANPSGVTESPSSPAVFSIADGDRDTRLIGCRTDNCRGVSYTGSDSTYNACEFNRQMTHDLPGVPDAFSKSGSTVTLTDANGRFSKLHIGSWIKIAGSTTAANDGIYQITGVTPGSQNIAATLTYENAGGATELAKQDTSVYVIFVGEKVGFGNGATAIANSSGVVTFTANAAIFAAEDVGKALRLIDPPSAGNQGSFAITRFVSSTVVEYVNSAAVSETYSKPFTIDGFDSVKGDATVGPLITSMSTSVCVNSLTDTTLTMVTNAYAGRFLMDSAGVHWRIVSNTATVFTLTGGGTPAAGAYTAFAGATHGSTHGIYLFAGRSEIRIVDCTFRGVRTTAVKVSGSSVPIRNIEVTGCTAIECGAFAIAGADDAQEHTNISIHHNKIIDACVGRRGWNDQQCIGLYGARNVKITDNLITATHDAVPALIDSGGTLGGYYGIFAGRYIAGRSQPLENVTVERNTLVAEPHSTRASRVAGAAIHVERVGQRSKWRTATAPLPVKIGVSGSTVTLTDPSAFFHQTDVGSSIQLVFYADAGNNGVFTVTEVTSTTSLKFENGGSPNAGSKTAGTYRIKPKVPNASATSVAKRAATCSVSRNEISAYGATGIDTVACTGPEIVGDIFNGMGVAIVDTGSVGARILSNRELTAGTNAARIQVTSGTAWPFIDDNIITNGSLAGGNTAIDGTQGATRSDMGVGVDGGTAIDYPLCGKRGRAKTTIARAEIVFAFGSELVDGDNLEINGTVYTYKADSPGGGQFNSFASLAALVGSGFTAEDYGTGLAGAPTTGHMRVRLTSPANTADHGYIWRVNALNPTALVVLFNDVAAGEAICYTRGEGIPATGGPWAAGATTFTTTNATETVSISAHALPTGYGPVRLTTSGTLPTGYALATNYWIINTGANTLQLATSRANALAGTVVAITDDGTGTHTMTTYGSYRFITWSPACQLTAGVNVMADNLLAATQIASGIYHEKAAKNAGSNDVLRTVITSGDTEEIRWAIA